MATFRARNRRVSLICQIGGFAILFAVYGTFVALGKSSRLWGDNRSAVQVRDAEFSIGQRAEQQLQSPGASVYTVDNREGRHLLSLPNCTPPAIGQFPPTYFSQQQRKQGAIVLFIICGLYMFLGLALACDDYFVPSLERICEILKLQPDVAGATFMAAGSSAPELATAIIGVFVTKDDIGLGAVVGSAVFNIMFVVSVCALFAGAVVYLHWWPLIRDCSFYLLSIIALTLIIMDEIVTWYEALSLLVLYILYIVLMFFNPTLESWFIKKVTCCSERSSCPATSPTENGEPDCYDKTTTKGYVAMDSVRQETDSEDSSLEYKDNHTLLPSSVQITNQHSLMQRRPTDDSPYLIVKKDEEVDDRLKIPSSSCKCILWVVALPLSLLMYVTIPDTRLTRWRRWFFVTFIMSCVWISIFSYLMVWMITVVGYTLHIPDSIMGLTFIAAGVSVPDAIASVIVIREGQGDMAVSNAVGSNVFDILLCLGLPWFLKTVVVVPNSVIQVYSAGLTYAALTLLSTVVFLVFATWVNGWRLTKRYGVILMIAYVAITILTALYELNIFGYVHPPACNSHL